jgi:hypothetical protein
VVFPDCGAHVDDDFSDLPAAYDEDEAGDAGLKFIKSYYSY